MNEGLEIIGNIDEKSIPSNFAIRSSSSMVFFFILTDRLVTFYANNSFTFFII